MKNIDKTKLSRAFSEWERRYLANPAEFMSEMQIHTKETPQSYGDIAAEFLLKLLSETQPT